MAQIISYICIYTCIHSVAMQRNNIYRNDSLSKIRFFNWRFSIRIDNATCNDSVEINPVFFHFADVQQLADAVSLFIHGRQNRALWSAPSPQVWTDRYNQITSKNGKVYLIYLINKKVTSKTWKSYIYKYIH